MAVKDLGAEELRELIRRSRERLEIVDVRTLQEYEAVHIAGSKLIPMAELARRIGEIDWSKEVIVVCRSGRRSALVAKLAAAAGKEVGNLRFGLFECSQTGGEFLEGPLAGR